MKMSDCISQYFKELQSVVSTLGWLTTIASKTNSARNNTQNRTCPSSDLLAEGTQHWDILSVLFSSQAGVSWGH